MIRFACKLADLVFILSARYPTAERYCREYIVPSAKGIAISYSDEDMRRERGKTGMPPAALRAFAVIPGNLPEAAVS